MTGERGTNTFSVSHLYVFLSKKIDQLFQSFGNDLDLISPARQLLDSVLIRIVRYNQGTYFPNSLNSINVMVCH
jgi:hypothetical protein